MPKEERNELYDKTIKRLARAGAKDPTNQIIFLAEEIERYRAKIRGLEDLLRGIPPGDEKRDAQLSAALSRVAEEYERAKRLEYVRNPLAWALYETWKVIDRLEIRP